jgi:hypothetical protein
MKERDSSDTHNSKLRLFKLDNHRRVSGRATVLTAGAALIKPWMLVVAI